jgi:Protein of unknown function (DUF2934)
MAKRASTRVTKHAESGLRGAISAEERQHMIREAAYYRYVERGFVHGHDLNDWLAAEADLNMPSPEQRPTAPVETPEYEVQQSSVHGPREDEALKRMVRQHPERATPQVEGV